MKKLFLFLSLLVSSASAKEQFFVARHVHPLTISSDGSRLYALDSANGRLSIFATGTAPVLIREIPVGLLPVSVRLRTPDEAWVVNELSDSVSVVSLSKKVVIATIPTGDEPGDIAFIDDQAFVTCSRANRIDVFDTLTHQKTSEIALEGLFPRSLAVSPDQNKLYVSFLLTSNGTTILHRNLAPPQEIPDWAPADLPTPPQTGKIVPIDHPQIPYEVVDHDVAIISVNEPSEITYLENLGTNIFSLTTLPDGKLIAPHSEARNLIRLEPELRGRFTKTRLAIIADQTTSQIDLNLDPDLTFPEIDSSAASSALAQVKITLPDSDGEHLWLAAFGSDRLARLRISDQAITSIIDLRASDSASERNSKTMRGPRGLALHPSLPHLYVLNKLSHTLTTINTDSAEVIAETSLSTVPDIAPELKLGRGFLFDARLSANGTVSCASCHIDLERDGMAWNLGDPNLESFSVPGALLSVHRPDLFRDREMHPMKGPMVTQTLIGLIEQTKFHWRGDKPSIQSFNSTFPNLLAAEPLSDSDMDLVAAYLQTLRHHPNPHLQLDRNLPDELNGGNPTDGIAVFTLFENHCSACHTLPSGSSNNIDIPSTVGSFQPLKDSPLRTTYQRHHLNPEPGARSLSGFGLGSDGSLHELPIGHAYDLHILDDINRPLAVREREKRDLSAFILALDSGTAPAIGHSITFQPHETSIAEKLNRLAILESQASLGSFTEVAVVAHGLFRGKSRSFHYLPDLAVYRPDRQEDQDISANALLTPLAPGDVITFTGVPVSEASALSTDRNRNSIPDQSEPAPLLSLGNEGSLIWAKDSPFWYPEFSSDFAQWIPLTTPRDEVDSQLRQSSPVDARRGFYRLRSTR